MKNTLVHIPKTHPGAPLGYLLLSIQEGGPSIALHPEATFEVAGGRGGERRRDGGS